jgi:hypothetical protein
MVTEAQAKASAKYVRERCRTYVLRCNRDSDADVIAALSSQPNVAGYLKSLVRADVARRADCDKRKDD